MNVLELFSGTGSIGKICNELGWDSISLDLDERADIVCDILDWDFKVYPPDYFNMIWASPPCDNYSRLNYSMIGRKFKSGMICSHDTLKEGYLEADKLVKKVLEIINYFNPEIWFIENPQTGMLKDREFMKDLFFVDVDYCMFSDWGYRKRTRIWTNRTELKNKLCDKNCGNMINIRKHKMDISGVNMSGMKRIDLRHRIPPDLIFYLFIDEY